MILWNLKYTVGYWPRGQDMQMLVGLRRTGSDLKSPLDILKRPWTKRQMHNGEPDEPNFELDNHPCINGPYAVGHSTTGTDIDGKDKANPHDPLGTTWGILGDGTWAHLDMACARWLWEGFGQAPWYMSGTQSYCRSYYGTRYWENFIATANDEGMALKPINGEVIIKGAPGGWCDFPIIQGGCGDLVPDWPQLDPWYDYKDKKNDTLCE